MHVIWTAIVLLVVIVDMPILVCGWLRRRRAHQHRELLAQRLVEDLTALHEHVTAEMGARAAEIRIDVARTGEEGREYAAQMYRDLLERLPKQAPARRAAAKPAAPKAASVERAAEKPAEPEKKLASRRATRKS